MSEIDKVIEKCTGDNLPHCQAACPLHVEVKSYVVLIREGKYSEALKSIKMKLPFPGIMARICTHPCEDMCKRKEVEEPIAIAALKRAAANHSREVEEDLTIAEEKRERIAIVGGGPAGLMAAYDLRRIGYRVTIFEALPILGGMLSVGIPQYRLPRDILQTELSVIQKLGIEVKLNTRVGTDVRFSDMKKDFDAIFLAIGAHKGRKMGIEGDEGEGVVDGVQFLREVNLDKRVEGKDKVVVVGGGNVAVDCARTCLRLGFKGVTILYRRSRAEMPAMKEEVEEAEKEGVKINFLAAPVRVLTKDGKITGAECIKIELREPDASGRRRPIPMKGSEFIIEADMIISAIGEQPDLSFLGEEEESLSTKEGLLQVNPITLKTGIPGIFAGGDAVTGPANVIDALAAGRKAAISIDRIKGENLTISRGAEGSQESKLVVKIEGIPKKTKIGMPGLSLDQRRGNFKEVKLCFSKDQAKEEAGRCLQCECKLCVKDCEFLKSYCETPKELAEKFRDGYFREKPDIPYSCNLCGLCEKLCPEQLNVGQMCLEIRQQLVAEKLAPLPRHQSLIRDQEWVASDSFTLTLPDPKLPKCERVFFPGCNLSAYSPELVIKTYEYLQSNLPGTGIILGCCGAPTHDIGEQSRFLEIFLRKVASEMERLGASELIASCPHCYHTFKENAPYIQLRSLYELIAEHGLPEEAKTRNGKIFTMHDSCKTRYEGEIQDSVREIVKGLGYQIGEMVYSRDKTRCCGMGGMAAYVDIKLTNRITMRRLEEMPYDVVSYCASCRNAFALVGKPSLHILDLIFNPEWEKAARQPALLGASRQKRQSQLRAQLLKRAITP